MEIDINNIHLSTEEGGYVAIIANKAYKVNSIFFKVLCIWKSGNALEDAIKQVSTETGIDYNILLNKFTTFINTAQKVKNKSYIHLKHVVIKERLVNTIAHSLTFFFSKYAFITLLFSCLTINIAYFCMNYKQLGSMPRPTFEIGVAIFLGYLLSLIIHEIGHAAATASIGRKAKEIGFGFYMMFPVFYTDVTSAWNMGKKERILVNIGGIYFQLMINTIIITLLSLFSQYAWIRTLNGLVFSNAIVVFMSITPFFRNDGYWILSDYWNIPNLLKKSDKALLHILGRSKEENDKDKRILLFGLANNLFRLYIFICLALNVHKNLIDIISHTHQSKIPNILISTFFSLIGIYLLFVCYYKMIRYGNQNGY